VIHVVSTRRYISIVLVALLILSITPITLIKIPTALAEPAKISVSNEYLYYNILRVEVVSPPTEPPVVAVKVAGETKYYLVMAYVGGNTWVAYVALKDAKDISFKGGTELTGQIGSAPKVGDAGTNAYYVRGATVDVTNKLPDLVASVLDENIEIKGLASPEVMYLHKIAVGGTANVNVTIDKDIDGIVDYRYNSGENASRIWPFINVLDVAKLGLPDIGYSIVFEFAGERVSVTYGPSLAKFTGFDKEIVAPEGTLKISFEDPSLLTDPTVVTSGYNKLYWYGKASGSTLPISVQFKEANVIGAIRAALEEKGVTGLEVNAELSVSNGELILKVTGNAKQFADVKVFGKACIELEFSSGYSLSTTIYLAPSASDNIEITVLDNAWTLDPNIDVNTITKATLKLYLYFIPYASWTVSIAGKSPPGLDLTALPVTSLTLGGDGVYTASLKVLGIDRFQLGIVTGLAASDEIKKVFEATTTYAFAAYEVYDADGNTVLTYLTIGDLLPESLVYLKTKDVVGNSVVWLRTTSTVRMSTALVQITPIEAHMSDSIKISIMDNDSAGRGSLPIEVELLISTAGAGQKTATLEAEEVETGVFEVSLPKTLSKTDLGFVNGVLHITPEALGGGIAYEVKVLDKYTSLGPVGTLTEGKKLEDVLKLLMVRGYVVVAPTSIEVPASAMPEDIIEIKLESKNLDVSSGKDHIELNVVGNKIEVYWSDAATGPLVGSFTFKKTLKTGQEVAWTPRVLNTYIEESAPGTFIIKIYLQNVEAKEIIKVSYFDNFVGKVVATSMISIGGVKGEIEFNRDKIHLPVYSTSESYDRDSGEYKPEEKGGSSILFVIRIKDPDWDKTAAIDRIPADKIKVEVYDAEGQLVGEANIEAIETEPRSGVFKATIRIAADTTDRGKLHVGTIAVIQPLEKAVGGKIRVLYYDPLGTVTKSVSITPISTDLMIEPVEAAMGQTIELKIKAPELDSLPSDLGFWIKVVDAKGIPHMETASVNDLTGGTYEVEDGVFVLKFTPADLLRNSKIAKEGDLVKYAGSTIEIKYCDPVGVMSTKDRLIEDCRSVHLKVKSHDLVVDVKPEEAGPYTWLVLHIKDPDLAFIEPKIVLEKYVSIATSIVDASRAKRALLRAPDILRDWNATAGEYWFRIKLVKVKYTPEGAIDRQYVEEMLDQGYIVVAAHDKVSVVVKDVVDAAGRADVPRLATVDVKTVTGDLEVPTTVRPDSVFMIRVEDLDANRDPTRMETIEVYVSSSALPGQWIRVTLVETDDDTGVFEQRVLVTSDPADIGKPNTVYAPEGSTIVVKYRDLLGADAKETEVVKEISVVAAPAVPYPIVPTAEEAKLIYNGEEVTKIPPGAIAYISIPVNNTDARAVSFYAIVIVEKDGVPVGVSLATYTVPGKTSQVIYVPLPIIREAGTYTVRILFWSDIVEQRPLAEEAVELPIEVSS